MKATVLNMVFRWPLLLDCQWSELPFHKGPLGIPRMCFCPKMESVKAPCKRPMYLTIHNRTKSDNLNRKTAVVWRPTSRVQLPFPLSWFLPLNYRYPRQELQFFHSRLCLCCVVFLTCFTLSSKTNLWLNPIMNTTYGLTSACSSGLSRAQRTSGHLPASPLQLAFTQNIQKPESAPASQDGTAGQGGKLGSSFPLSQPPLVSAKQADGFPSVRTFFLSRTRTPSNPASGY